MLAGRTPTPVGYRHATESISVVVNYRGAAGYRVNPSMLGLIGEARDQPFPACHDHHSDTPVQMTTSDEQDEARKRIQSALKESQLLD